MKYFAGCDVGSTYTKAVILDENGKIVATTIQRSKINAEQSSVQAVDSCLSQVDGISKPEDLAYIVGTGYGRNRVHGVANKLRLQNVTQFQSEN